MPDLRGRTALVSGGSRGLGAAIAVVLAECGADVAINYRRDLEAAEATAAQVRALGRKAGVYQADVSDFEACRAMTEAALRDLGPIDVLVHNAGVAYRGGLVTDTRLQDYQRVIGVIAYGGVYLAQLLVPQMRERERGDVILISSSATQVMLPHASAYNMAKAALEALGTTLAKEEREHGIRVNIVAPGLMDTDMGRRGMQAAQGVENLDDIAASQPFGLVCTPRDVANVVAFLCSEEGRYVNAQRVYVDGGGF